MGWPQITMIVLLAISLFQAIMKLDRPQGGLNFISTVLGIAFNVFLLIYGGFFK